tara:strand:+ start:355 stop:1023 length:669 start_codon:yes stop_codon:yes gene_type:complete
MARKTLLTESEIRQFMKLANIKPLQEMGGSYGMPPGMRDDEDEDPPGMRDMREGEDEDEDPPGMRDMREEEGEEEPPAEMDAPAPEAGGDMEMDMDMGGDDMGADMDMGAEGGAKEEQFADIVDKLADLLGLDADVEVGEGEMEMGGEAMDDEGGDLEGAMDAPVGDDDDMGVEVEDDELMGEEEIVQEVARRVAARLIREKKQDATANKLAERIFRRLASK